jgi:hypothetical protein
MAVLTACCSTFILISDTDTEQHKKGVDVADFDNLIDFINTLHRHQTRGVLSFEALTSSQREMFRPTEFSKLKEWIDTQHDNRAGIYLRQARLDPSSQTCRKTDVVELTHIWVDIDGATTERVDDIVKKFDPTYVIHSGGGLHVYWRLPSPVADAVQFQKAETVMKLLAEAMDGDPAPTHVASLLRLPFTTNFKYDPPVVASIVYADADKEQTLYELENRALANEDPYMKVVRFLSTNTRVSMTTDDWQRVIDNLSVSGPDNEFGGRNNCVVKLAGYWTREQISPEIQIKTLLSYGCDLPVREVGAIVKRIWQKENAQYV